MINCPNSMSPSSDELLRYTLDGEPLSELSQAHVSTCPFCQERASTLARMNVFLVSHLYRSQCPTPMEIANYCSSISSSLTTEEERTRIAQHIRECPLCTSDAESFRADIASLRASNQAPTQQRASVYTFSAPATVKRLVATLQTQRPQLVTRNTKNELDGNSTGDNSWPKHFKAEMLDISLHLSRNNSGEIMLLGLFTSMEPSQDISTFEGSIVDLYAHPVVQEERARLNGHASKPLMSSPIDDLGNIVFKSVPIGIYYLLVHLADAELYIGDITISGK